eukprot:2159840-Amphidinium_carterae.1
MHVNPKAGTIDSNLAWDRAGNDASRVRESNAIGTEPSRAKLRGDTNDPGCAWSSANMSELSHAKLQRSTSKPTHERVCKTDDAPTCARSNVMRANPSHA